MHNGGCYPEYMPIRRFRNTIFLGYVTAQKFSPYSLTLEIGDEFVREVLLSSIQFFLHLGLELSEVGDDFTLLLHREDPCVVRVLVDEGDVITTSSDRQHLSWSPYIRVDYVKEAFAYVALLWEWESMLFAELTCFAHSVDSFRLEDRKSDDDSL